MKQVTLIPENAKDIADKLYEYDIIVGVVTERDPIGKDGLINFGFTKPCCCFYPTDGTITFKFDEENKKVIVIKQ